MRLTRDFLEGEEVLAVDFDGDIRSRPFEHFVEPHLDWLRPQVFLSGHLHFERFGY